MSDLSNLRYLTLAVLGIPYAVAVTLVLEPLVIADRLPIALALPVIVTPTVVGAIGALFAIPRR